MTLVSGEVNTYVGLDIKSDGTVLVFAAGTDNFHADSLNLRLERTLAERFSAVFGGSHVVRVVHEIPQPVGF